MGKLYKIRRAIIKDPESWYRFDALDVRDGYIGLVRRTYGAYIRQGKNGLVVVPLVFGRSYRDFVRKTLIDIGEIKRMKYDNGRISGYTISPRRSRRR